MNEAKALRTLADRIDELESLKTFPADIVEPGEVTVNWTEGKEHDGYAPLSSAISALVSQHWSALRSQVLKAKESEVQAARNVWSAMSSSSDAVETLPTTSNTEMGLRRYG